MQTSPQILIAVPPYFDRRFLLSKDDRAGMGDRKLRAPDEWNLPRRVHPIMDVLYGAALLRESGYDVVVDDDQFRDSTSYDAYERELSDRFETPPDLVFVRMSQASITYDIDVAQRLRILWPDASFHAFGGMFVAKDILEYVASFEIFDSLISSEFEGIATEVVEGWETGDPQGIHVFRDGEYVCVNPSPKLADVQSLPFPAYDLVDFSRIDVFRIITERGCPMACNYCTDYTVRGHKFRTRTPDQVIAEIMHCYNEFGAKKIAFDDPIFTLDQKRVLAICERLIEAGSPVRWYCQTHMKSVTPELLQTMREAGAETVAFGVESASADVLKEANRSFHDWEKMKENITEARRLGITTHGFFILCLPGETIKSVLETVKLAKWLGSDRSRFNLPSLYPGTGFYTQMCDQWGISPQTYPGGAGEFFMHVVTESVTPKEKPGLPISFSKSFSDRQAVLIQRAVIHYFLKGGGLGTRAIRRIKVMVYASLVLALGIIDGAKIKAAAKARETARASLALPADSLGDDAPGQSTPG